MGVTEVQLQKEEFTSTSRCTMANVDEYLAHIGYTGSKEPTKANLAALHSCHLLAVVFENISCIIGEKIKLDPDWIFEKIAKRGRGGFCFELNGVFHWLLKSLGYNVRMVSAAVAAPTPTGFSFPTDHLVNLVKIEDCQFLCDVGLVSIPPPTGCTVWWERREGQLTFRSGRQDSGAPSAGLTSSQRGCSQTLRRSANTTRQNPRPTWQATQLLPDTCLEGSLSLCLGRAFGTTGLVKVGSRSWWIQKTTYHQMRSTDF